MRGEESVLQGTPKEKGLWSRFVRCPPQPSELPQGRGTGKGSPAPAQGLEVTALALHGQLWPSGLQTETCHQPQRTKKDKDAEGSMTCQGLTC